MKDFETTNVDGVAPNQGWSHMKEAMAPDGFWQLWGCSASGDLRAAIRAAHKMKGEGDKALFTAQFNYKNYYRYEERTNREVVIHRTDKTFREDSYPAQIAQFFDVPVLAPPPDVEKRPEFYVFVWRKGEDGPGKTLLILPGEIRAKGTGTDFRLHKRSLTLEGKAGVRYVLDAPGADRDQAYFVTTELEVYRVNRGPTGDYDELEAI